VLPGKFFHLGSVTGYSINGHDISIDKPIEVFLEKAKFIHHYEGTPNAFILTNITVISGFAEIKVKVWGVML
ncbi:hypothetical protein, partial [Escherichia coli]|uniref:hypothetical protein n=1 Tax=Escherichia coli TaxID=562 RepID=UPI001961B920